MASSLQDLPEELLETIVLAIDTDDSLGRNSLVQLSRSCSRIRRVSLPELYRSVCIRRSETKSGAGSATLIVSLTRLDDFLTYISETDVILPCIRCIRINWAPDKSQFPPPAPAAPKPQVKRRKQAKKTAKAAKDVPIHELDYIQEFIRLANDQGRQAPRIHFCADFTDQNQEFRDWMLSLLKLYPIQILEIFLPPQPLDYLVFACYHKVGLRQLILSEFDRLVPVTRMPEPDPNTTIETLSIRSIGHHNSSMKAALIRPTGLKSIQIEFKSYSYANISSYGPGLGPELFEDLFLQHREKLEEFTWTIRRRDQSHIGIGTLQVLLQFRSLKRLSLPACFPTKSMTHAHLLSSLLPSSLEELQLELDEYEDSLQFRQRPSGFIRTMDTLCEWLIDIPENKATSLPNFRNLVLWQHDPHLAPFKPPVGWKKLNRLIKACAAQSIDCYYYIGAQPPLFGLRSSYMGDDDLTS